MESWDERIDIKVWTETKRIQTEEQSTEDKARKFKGKIRVLLNAHFQSSYNRHSDTEFQIVASTASTLEEQEWVDWGTNDNKCIHKLSRN